MNRRWAKCPIKLVDDVVITHVLVIVGLFNTNDMQHVLDRKKGQEKEPTLAEMTEKAIKILQKDKKGFFLMVEGNIKCFILN